MYGVHDESGHRSNDGIGGNEGATGLGVAEKPAKLTPNQDNQQRLDMEAHTWHLTAVRTV